MYSNLSAHKITGKRWSNGKRGYGDSRVTDSTLSFALAKAQDWQLLSTPCTICITLYPSKPLFESNDLVASVLPAFALPWAFGLALRSHCAYVKA